MLDTGLLGALVDTEPKAIVTGDRILSEYNGALMENYVAIELSLQGKTVSFIIGGVKILLKLTSYSDMTAEFCPLK